jgi:hypothetical protein
MADDELTEDEVYALAGAFPVASARTLLTMAGFPAWAVPETGFGNALEFWSMIAGQVAGGVMPDGRRRILAAARRRFPSSRKFPDPGAAEPSGAVESSGTAESSGIAAAAGTPAQVSVASSQGIQAGDRNVQVNIFGNALGQGQAPLDGDPADAPAGQDRPPLGSG